MRHNVVLSSVLCYIDIFISSSLKHVRAGKGWSTGSYRNRIRSHFSGESSPAASRRSLSVTPGRKISASAFEASGLR